MSASNLLLLPLLKSGFDVWRIEAPRFLLYGVVIVSTSLLLGMVPLVGPLLNIAIEGPLLAGIFIATRRVLAYEVPEIEDFTGGFRLVIPLMTVALLKTLLSIAGLFLLVIPGIVVYTLFSLALPIVLFEGKEAKAALRESWKRVLPHFWIVLTVGVLLGLLSTVVTYPVLETILNEGMPSLDTLLPSLLGSCFLTPLGAIYVTLIYFGLREEQTGEVDTRA
jgi:hypothetical protein